MTEKNDWHSPEEVARRTEEQERKARLKTIESQAANIMQSSGDVRERWVASQQLFAARRKRGARIESDMPYAKADNGSVRSLSFDEFVVWESEEAKRAIEFAKKEEERAKKEEVKDRELAERVKADEGRSRKLGQSLRREPRPGDAQIIQLSPEQHAEIDRLSAERKAAKQPKPAAKKWWQIWK